MPFSEPRYVRCPDCYGEGAVVNELDETIQCPLCEGRGKILDEQIPEEDE
jgi:DnaJ-class molecular chaperone